MTPLELSLAYSPSTQDLFEIHQLPIDRLPKISVVIPSYQQATYIRETLDSIFSQNYPNFDVFVADGGSTDGTLAVLVEYQSRHPDRLRYVSERDGGQQHAVNKGISATDGDIIAWINSDDVYLPECFWKIVSFFHFNRCALVVYGRNRYTNEKLKPIVDYPVDWSPIIHEQRRRMMHFCLPPQPSLFFKRMACTLSGKLNSDVVDYELWLRWQRDLPFYFIDDFLSLSRLHKQCKTIKDQRPLMRRIQNTVWSYYLTVPYSWMLKSVYNETYGDAWTTGTVPEITATIRMRAVWRWYLFHTIRIPILVFHAIRRMKAFLKESRCGHV